MDNMVATLPDGQSLLVRTYFVNDAEWTAICAECQHEYMQEDGSVTKAALTLVDNRDFDERTPAELISVAADLRIYYLFLADETTFANPEHPVLVLSVPRSGQPNSTDVEAFRVVPPYLADVENNLSIGNLSFLDFHSLTDTSGVYRGISRATVTKQRTISKDELVAAAGTNITTSTLERFYRAVLNYNVDTLPPATVLLDQHVNYEYVLNADYSTAYEVVGRDEYLDETKKGGTALGLTMPVYKGYWSAVLDSQTLRPRAAMLVQGSPGITGKQNSVGSGGT